MTTVAAIQGNGWCVIAADSQSSSGNIKSDMSTTGKIIKNGSYLIAASGTVRGLNILAHGFSAPTPPKYSRLDAFMTRSFIPKLRNTFIDNGYEIKPDNSIASFDNDIIVSIKGIIYSIDEAYGWERSAKNLYTSGSGSDLALGAMVALDGCTCSSMKSAIDITTKAVAIATKWDMCSGFQIQVAVQYDNGDTSIVLLDEV